MVIFVIRNAQLLSELTAAQEDALLEDVSEYLEVLSDSGREWGDSSVDERPQEAGTPQAKMADQTTIEDTENTARAPANSNGEEQYRSPSGKLYSKKVNAFFVNLK